MDIRGKFDDLKYRLEDLMYSASTLRDRPKVLLLIVVGVLLLVMLVVGAKMIGGGEEQDNNLAVKIPPTKVTATGDCKDALVDFEKFTTAHKFADMRKNEGLSKEYNGLVKTQGKDCDGQQDQQDAFYNTVLKDWTLAGPLENTSAPSAPTAGNPAAVPSK